MWIGIEKEIAWSKERLDKYACLIDENSSQFMYDILSNSMAELMYWLDMQDKVNDYKPKKEPLVVSIEDMGKLFFEIRTRDAIGSAYEIPYFKGNGEQTKITFKYSVKHDAYMSTEGLILYIGR